MTVISPMFKYWIDESSLISLSEDDKAEFVENVDNAAAEWNSVRIADFAEEIISLQKLNLYTKNKNL